jgi:hypothetical protein
VGGVLFDNSRSVRVFSKRSGLIMYGGTESNDAQDAGLWTYLS